MPTLCESLITHLTQNAQIGGWWVESNGDYLCWTDNLYTLFGKKKQQFAPSLDIALTFFAPLDQEKIRKALERAHQARESIDIIVPAYIGPIKKYVRICGERVDDIPGISLLGTIQDISELKRLACETELKHFRYKNVVESAREAIISTDDALGIVFFNRAAERMFGWRADDVLGMPVTILLSQRSHTPYIRHVVENILVEAPFRARERLPELWALHKDGREFLIEASLSQSTTEDITISTVIIRDVSARKANEQRIYRLAFTDQLTGLANRNALYHDFAELTASASFLEVALIDLDRFKDINDSLGHHIGDQALAEIGKMLSAISQECHCHAYRLAGDEFVLVSPGREIEQTCRRLLAKGNAPVLVEGHALWPGLSIGVARSPDHAIKLEELIQCAGAALQQAKQKGRGRLERFSSDLLSYVKTKALLNSRLEECLAKRELSYSFQPIVDLNSGEIVGYEALARWQHDGQAKATDTFIPLAEEFGHIDRIQEYLFDYIAGCLDVLGETAYLSLNISPAQLASDRLYARLQHFLYETKFPPSRLELELTERSLLLVGEEVLGMLQRLKLLGVRLNIDDFGTGYSCLSYLKDLPIDKIKIDRSFISNIGTDSKHLAVVKAIIHLAKNLGMETVAEGIEKTSQADVFKRLGCQYGQGYLFSKPLTVEEMRAAQQMPDRDEV